MRIKNNSKIEEREREMKREEVPSTAPRSPSSSSSPTWTFFFWNFTATAGPQGGKYYFSRIASSSRLLLFLRVLWAPYLLFPNRGWAADMLGEKKRGQHVSAGNEILFEPPQLSICFSACVLFGACVCVTTGRDHLLVGQLCVSLNIVPVELLLPEMSLMLSQESFEISLLYFDLYDVIGIDGIYYFVWTCSV